MKSAGKTLTCGKGLCWSQRTGTKNSVTGSFTHMATARAIRPHTCIRPHQARRAPTQGRDSVPTHVGLAHLREGLHSPFCRPPWFSPCAPWPGRHPGRGCSYMCPAQASNTRNPPAAPEMCQLGLRTMPSWVERAAALTQTHLGQEPHFQWL